MIQESEAAWASARAAQAQKEFHVNDLVRHPSEPSSFTIESIQDGKVLCSRDGIGDEPDRVTKTFPASEVVTLESLRVAEILNSDTDVIIADSAQQAAELILQYIQKRQR